MEGGQVAVTLNGLSQSDLGKTTLGDVTISPAFAAKLSSVNVNPASFGPGPMRPRALVANTSESRRRPNRAIAPATSFSLSPSW